MPQVHTKRNGRRPLAPRHRSLNDAMAAAMLKYHGPNADACARQFLRKHGVPFYQRGRAVLVLGLERRQRELARHTSTRPSLRAVSGGQR